MTKGTLVFALGLGMLTVGCANQASFVRKDALGGRVALEGAYMPAMANARLLMAEHCHGRVDTIEQGGAVEFRCQGSAGSDRPTQQLALNATRAGL